MQMNSKSETHFETAKTLRFVFVGFLFAYAAGRLAVDAFPIMQEWLSGKMSAFQFARAFHLAVAFVAITFSWVYWSKKAGSDEQLDDVITLPYLILVIDIILVMLYVFIIEAAEALTPEADHEFPSAQPESLLLFLVYMVYLAWDFLHDMLYRPRRWRSGSERIDNPDSRVLEASRLRSFVWAFFVKCYASGLSAVLAFSVFYIARRIEPTLQHREILLVVVVVFLNLAEVANLVIFRTSKLGEDWLQDKFGNVHECYGDERRFRKTDDEGQKLRRCHVWGFGIAAVIYLGTLCAAASIWLISRCS